MWAHYAKSYTGCCIGIDIQKLINYLTDNEQGGGIEKVNYTQNFIPVNYFRKPLRALSNWITTKSKEWSYEKEIRLFIFKKEGNPYWDLKIKDKSIFNELYLGCQMEKNKKDDIIKLCRSLYPHLKIYDMKLAPTTFALKAELIK